MPLDRSQPPGWLSAWHSSAGFERTAGFPPAAGVWQTAAMRLLLYEWCSSGGLPGDEATIAREGRLMLEALAADAAKDTALELTVLVADGQQFHLTPAVRRVGVRPGHDLPPLVAAAKQADWTLLVAPESDGILLERVRAVRAVGGRVLAPADRVIALASDKQATIDRLADCGIPVPAGRSLAAGEPVPRHFRLPAVRKARGGCGGEDLVVIRRHPCPAAAVPTRLEAFAAGIPAGVSLLCGPRGAISLPVMRQRFDDEASPRYLGSDMLTDASAAARAAALARRAAAAIDADAGWLGVDLILGRRDDGRDDRVLEVNPRMTTSIVGQSGLFASSLVAAMIDAATGNLEPLEAAVTADADAGRFRLFDG
jgi:predicted ATP-grasp superfamily ATP-dependent carboligase